MNKTQSIRINRWLYRLQIINDQIDEMYFHLSFDLEMAEKYQIENKKIEQKKKDEEKLIFFSLAIEDAIEECKKFDLTPTDGD